VESRGETIKLVPVPATAAIDGRRCKERLGLHAASLYPALHRLEVQGWIASEWRLTENNRNAKDYRLTRAGRKQLEREATRWNAIVDAIAAVLREA